MIPKQLTFSNIKKEFKILLLLGARRYVESSSEFISMLNIFTQN